MLPQPASTPANNNVTHIPYQAGTHPIYGAHRKSLPAFLAPLFTALSKTMASVQHSTLLDLSRRLPAGNPIGDP